MNLVSLPKFPDHQRVLGNISSPIRGSIGASDEAQYFEDWLQHIQRRLKSVKVQEQLPIEDLNDRPVPERLFSSLANAKILTSQVAMHLSRVWRNRLFAQLDDLLDADDWHDEDEPLLSASFETYLRMILYVQPERQPSLGLSNNGHLLAAWVSGSDRLTMQFFPNDSIRWTVSCEMNGERERGAGDTPVRRLLAVLAPYGPDRWFANAADAAAAG